MASAGFKYTLLKESPALTYQKWLVLMRHTVCLPMCWLSPPHCNESVDIQVTVEERTAITGDYKPI